MSGTAPFDPTSVTRRTFQRTVSGYQVAHVHAFLRQLAAELERRDAGGPWFGRAADIRAARFPLEPDGYGTYEVDDYLELVAREFERREAAGRPAGGGPNANGQAPTWWLTPAHVQNQEFTKSAGGFAMAEVDVFLDYLTGELAGLAAGASPTLDPEQVRHAAFPRVVRGYDRQEVTFFLGRVADQLAEARRRLNEH